MPYLIFALVAVGLVSGIPSSLADPGGAGGSAPIPTLYKITENGISLSQLSQILYGRASMWKEIAQWNGLPAPYLIRTGKTLVLNKPPTYAAGQIQARLLNFWRARLALRDPDSKTQKRVLASSVEPGKVFPSQEESAQAGSTVETAKVEPARNPVIQEAPKKQPETVREAAREPVGQPAETPAHKVETPVKADPVKADVQAQSPAQAVPPTAPAHVEAEPAAPPPTAPTVAAAAPAAITPEEDLVIQRGSKLSQMGMYDDALVVYGEYLAKHSDDAPVLLAKGKVLAATKSYDKAIATLEKSRKKDPSGTDVWIAEISVFHQAKHTAKEKTLSKEFLVAFPAQGDLLSQFQADRQTASTPQ